MHYLDKYTTKVHELIKCCLMVLEAMQSNHNAMRRYIYVPRTLGHEIQVMSATARTEDPKTHLLGHIIKREVFVLRSSGL